MYANTSCMSQRGLQGLVPPHVRAGQQIAGDESGDL